MMLFKIAPNPVLIVQPTGTGKSTVPLTVSVLDAGITIIIENTIALGIDQTSKANFISSSSNKLEIQCYHLDSINNEEDQTKISSLILQTCHLVGNTAFILFASPETLLKATWNSFIDQCILQSYLKIVCIDEIHLFVEFGLGFRYEYLQLKEKLFNKLVETNETLKIPIILMTATFNKEYLKLLESMIGIKIKLEHTFWASSNQFKKRHINICLLYSVHQSAVMKSQLKHHLK